MKKRTVLRKTHGNSESNASNVSNSDASNEGNGNDVPNETIGHVSEQSSSNVASERSGAFVIPGDFIGTTEEFRAGNSTYEKMGGIYAATTGTTRVDQAHRSVSVFPRTDVPPFLRRGDVIVGQVTGLRESLAMVAIAGAKGVADREISNAAPAVVHVSNIKRAYVKDITNEFGLFDIIKAKVIDIKNMRLDTSESDMGVVKAFCSSCRAPMKLNDSKLKCSECGKIETRKLASTYGTGII